MNVHVHVFMLTYCIIVTFALEEYNFKYFKEYLLQP